MQESFENKIKKAISENKIKFENNIKKAIEEVASEGIWTTRNGEKIRVEDMETTHIINSIQCIDRSPYKEYFKPWRIKLKEELEKRKLELNKPCPICGSEDIQLISYEHDECVGMDFDEYAVICFSCGLRTGGSFSKIEVVQQWNKLVKK